MNARFTIIAAAALTLATAAVGAQPPKAPASAPSAAHAPSHVKPVVLASVDQVAGTDATPASTATAKHHPRVSSCRCGDLQTQQPDEQEQQ